MKKFKSLFPILSIAVTIIALSGCATHGGLLTPQVSQVPQVQTVTETNKVTVVETNTVTQTLTNGVTVTNTVYQTNISVQMVPVTVTNLVNVTNGYAVNASVSSTLAGLQSVNTLTSPADPFSGWVSLVLGAATAGLGFYASVKTKQAQTHSDVAQTVITAVEGLAPATAAAVKAAVSAQATKMGTANEVQTVVQAVTANLPTAPAAAPVNA